MKHRWPAGGGWTVTFCCETLFTKGYLISLRVSGLVSGDLVQVMDASAHHAAGSLGPLAGRAHRNRKGGAQLCVSALTPRRPGGEPLTSVRNVPRNPLLPLLKTGSAKQGTQTSHGHLESGTKTGSEEMAPQSCSPTKASQGREEPRHGEGGSWSSVLNETKGHSGKRTGHKDEAVRDTDEPLEPLNSSHQLSTQRPRD